MGSGTLTGSTDSFGAQAEANETSTNFKNARRGKRLLIIQPIAQRLYYFRIVTRHKHHVT